MDYSGRSILWGVVHDLCYHKIGRIVLPAYFPGSIHHHPLETFSKSNMYGWNLERSLEPFAWNPQNLDSHPMGEYLSNGFLVDENNGIGAMRFVTLMSLGELGTKVDRFHPVIDGELELQGIPMLCTKRTTVSLIQKIRLSPWMNAILTEDPQTRIKSLVASDWFMKKKTIVPVSKIRVY